MPQTFYIASRTAHIKGFTVKSSWNQHRIDLHKLLLTASMYFMSSYTPVFKTKEQNCILGLFFSLFATFFCILPHVDFTDLRKKNVNAQPGQKKNPRYRTSSVFKPPNTTTETVFTNQFFFILNLSEGNYVIYHIYNIYI